jgi:CRISPR-associated endonuclease/helicase Cas3
MDSLSENFVRRFRILCYRDPFPWQIRVFEDLLRGPECWPNVITAPTGAGKTNFMAAWLLALVAEAETGKTVRIPRRLVWVVNRRVVVDQATSQAEDFAERCRSEPELRKVLLGLAGLAFDSAADPLAVSTLRGEKADNREWRKDVSRAAVVVGTVDMIGSRLLFSGYGDGSASRPQHAALIGHDALIVNDEAHLTPAFADLLESVKLMQAGGGIKNFHAIRLTATLQGEQRYPKSFDEDLALSAAFRKRYGAIKRLELLECRDRKDIAKKMVEIAASDGSARTIVFLTTPREVRDFARDLEKRIPRANIAVITGTQRGFERDRLVDDPRLQAFLKEERPDGRYWLISTSAAEVGIDATSDRMVSSLDTVDHLLQRFGRLNRFGEESETVAHVVYVKTLVSKLAGDRLGLN